MRNHLLSLKERQKRVSEGMKLSWARRAKELDRKLADLRKFEEESKKVVIHVGKKV